MFVTKDYKSRETGAITRMREDLELETLEDRRLLTIGFTIKRRLFARKE
jgi:hypothetical protein